MCTVYYSLVLHLGKFIKAINASDYTYICEGGVTQFNVVIVSRLTWDNATVLHCEEQDTETHRGEHSTDFQLI